MEQLPLVGYILVPSGAMSPNRTRSNATNPRRFSP